MRHNLRLGRRVPHQHLRQRAPNVRKRAGAVSRRQDETDADIVLSWVYVIAVRAA